jgi:SAM-dependent methyltransferase
MGIGNQEMQFLTNCAQHGAFGKTITAGRQGLHVQKHNVEYFLNIKDFIPTQYCDEMLINYFGATKVDSIDYSDYEGANIIHDMNLPLDPLEEYDTVIDSGTLEHVFNINEAFKNITKLCKVGGQILHALPANNNCGHGFWQFSPELFFALYSEKNGYKDTQVFVGDTANLSWTYELDPPGQGERHDIQHPNPVYVMVRTVLARKDFSHTNIQQSDYDYQWRKAANE